MVNRNPFYGGRKSAFSIVFYSLFSLAPVEAGSFPPWAGEANWKTFNVDKEVNLDGGIFLNLAPFWESWEEEGLFLKKRSDEIPRRPFLSTRRRGGRKKPS